jgi:hypothetical protein
MSSVAAAKTEHKKSEASTKDFASESVQPQASAGAVAGLPRFLLSDAGAWIQAKLTINRPDDPYEEEADRVTDRVMRTPESGAPQTSPMSGAVSAIQRKCSCGGNCETCQAQPRNEYLQMKPANSGQSGLTTAPSSVNETLRSPGRPLDAQTRSFAEPRFGRDLSKVRVHTDARAANSAREISARAYTVGHQIVFGEGQFAPATQPGRRLLVHELTHVLQQSGLGSQSAAPEDQVQRDYDDDWAALKAKEIDQWAWVLLDPYSFIFVRKQIDDVKRSLEDNVSAAFIELQFNAGRLDRFAADPEGRRTLDVLYDAVITGKVSDFERQQADRILDVKARHRPPASTAAAATVRNPMVFPIARSSAALKAKLLSSGKVSISYDDSVFDEEFRAETETLLSRHTRDEILNGFEVDPEETVGVRLFGADNGPRSYVPAIMLIDFANREDKGALWTWNVDDDSDRYAAAAAGQLSNQAWSDANPYRYIREQFEDLSSGSLSSYSEDNVAAAFISLQSQAGRLDNFAADPEGRRALDVLYAALITGKVSDFEQEQARKITEAIGRNRPAPDAATLAKLRNPMIFPVKDQRFFGSAGSGATLHAELLTNGNVRVYYDTTGVFDEEFLPETRTLLQHHTRDEIRSGFELDPDELVGAKLFDEEGEPLVYVPAIMLIDFANRIDQAFWGRFKEVTIMGATAGAGGLVSGVGALAMADRVVFVIGAASAIINDYRHEIMKSAGGRGFLSVWKYVDATVQYYGFARMGVDGIRMVKGRVGPALKDWKADTQSEARSVEIVAAQEAAENWLQAANEAEIPAAEKYIDEHPLHDVEGDVPGKRRAKTGDHEMQEVVTPDGISCELYSKPTPVLCRDPLGTPKGEPAGKTQEKETGKADRLAKKNATDEMKERLKDVDARIANPDPAVQQQLRDLDKDIADGERQAKLAYDKVRQMKVRSEGYAQAKAEWEQAKKKLEALRAERDPIVSERAELYHQKAALQEALEEGRKREMYMGPTPGKASPTGLEVQARMEKAGKLTRNSITGEVRFEDSKGVWRPLKDADMSHIQDAVTMWNTKFRFLGPRSPQVLAWMSESENYVLDYYGLNRSAGASLGEVYLPPPWTKL